VRAVLIINPKATSTSASARKAVLATFERTFDLKVKQTKSRGHAITVAQRAADDGVDLVAVVGGDGTINEVINGLLHDRSSGQTQAPVLAIIPGGHANVLAYALGIVRDPAKAATQVTDLFLNGHTQSIGLGLANNRWFAINAGLGIDAEIVSAVEDLRRRGLSASPATYIAGFMKSWAATDRWSGPMTIDGTGTDQDPQHVEGIVSTIIQNTAPWSMAGDLRLDGSQHASLNKGLDVVALQQLSTPTMMRIAGTLLTGKSIADLPETTVFTDLNSIHITAQRPMPVQIDGDLSGSTTDIRFESVPQALTVVASPQAPKWPSM